MSIAIDPLIQRKLEHFVNRRRRWTILYAALIALVVWVVGLLLFTVVDYLWIVDRGNRSLLSLATYVAAGLAAAWLIHRRLHGVDPLANAAVAIEQARPELRDQLLSAVELARAGDGNVPPGSQTFIGAAQKSVAGKLRFVDVQTLLPVRLLSKPIAIATAAILLCAALAVIPQLEFGRRFARAIIPGFDIDRVSRTRILVVRPAPPSRPVPADEITAIVATIDGQEADSARLQWRSDDGLRGQLDMHAVDASGMTNTDSGGPSFAVNLMVHQAVVSYRILAGDGVTRWQTLQPRMRPSVAAIEVSYAPPSYTQLDTTPMSPSDGNLTALRGTGVRMRVQFDMPVREATMRRMNSDRRIALQPDGNTWLVNTSIEADDRYQILAVSTETGFDNPLSPQYAITPIDDLPPVANWRGDDAESPADKPKRELVTPFSKLNLAADFKDELPMAQVWQELSINSSLWNAIPLDGSLDTAQTMRKWTWDLDTASPPDRRISAGDILQTRVVAIDRKGQRGESAIKEFIVNDQEFDAALKRRLDSWLELAGQVRAWTNDVNGKLVELKIEVKPAETEPSSEDEATGDTLTTIVPQMIKGAATESEAAQLATIGRLMQRVERKLAQAENADSTKRGEFKSIANQTRLIGDLTRTEVAHHLGILLHDNVLRMSASIEPTQRQSDPIDWSNYSRFFEITRQQLSELTRVLDRVSTSIPDSTRQHNENLLRWIGDESHRLGDAISQGDQEQIVRGVARHVVDDLVNHRRSSLIDGRVAAFQIEYLKRSQNEIGWTKDAMSPLVKVAKELANTETKLKNRDSDEIRKARETIAQVQGELGRGLQAINDQLAVDASLHQSHPEADQRYVADAHLMQRVIDRIKDPANPLPTDKTLPAAIEEIAAAYHWLEAGHDVTQWGRELRSLADDDRWNANSPQGRVDAPNRIERFTNGLEFSANGLQSAGMPWPELEPIASQRWNSDVSEVSALIVSRRWNHADPIPAADKLNQRHASFVAATARVEPYLEAARQVLESYLPSIADQAREAAKTLRQSANDPASDEAQAQRDLAEQETDELRQLLADEANTQSLREDDGRRKARNADIAAAAIQQRMQELDDAATEAQKARDNEQQQANESLQQKTEQAAKTLDQIAQHYEQEAASPDASDPAQANLQSPLDAMAQELDLQKSIDQQFARSDAINKALNEDPRELLKRLQEELKRNELMQQELEDITGQTMQEAQRTLEAQAERERELQLQLERSDPALLTQKRELEEAIRRSAEIGTEVESALLSAAQQANNSQPNLPPESATQAAAAQQGLKTATQQLRDAINQANQVGSADNQRLSHLKERASEVQQSIAQAAATLQQNDQPLDQILADEKSKLEDRRLQDKQREMENVQRRARDNQAQHARNQQRRAAQRLQQAEQEERNAKSTQDRSQDNLRKTNERLARDSNNESLQHEVRRNSAEVANAKELAEAAKDRVELTKQTNEEAKARLDAVSRRPLTKLDTAQPAAQLAKQMQQQATSELEKARDRLAKASNGDAIPDALSPTAQAIESAETAQQRVGEEVSDAAADLARAARHQQRLGQLQTAGQTAQAAASVNEIAEGEVKAATDSLTDASQAAQASDPSTDANASESAGSARQSLRQSQEALAAQAAALAEMVQVANQNSQADSAHRDSDSAQSPAAQLARQLAQTLDELDQSLSAAQKPAADSSAQSAPTPAPLPTLDAASRQQAQKLAMQRSEAGQPPQEPSSDAAPSTEATESGDGESTAMANVFGIDAVGRDGDSNWGKLQAREAEDVAQERRIEISPQYRQQIEAYFRVIAEQAKATQ